MRSAFAKLDSMGAGVFKLPSDKTSRRHERLALFIAAATLRAHAAKASVDVGRLRSRSCLLRSAARAESPTNSPATPLQQSDACVRRLHEIYDEASRLEEKTPPEQVALADCVRSRVLKIKGLLDLTEGTQKDIQKAVRAAESDKAADYLGNVKISCARAEKLLLEAEGCATSLALKAAPAKEAPRWSRRMPMSQSTSRFPCARRDHWSNDDSSSAPRKRACTTNSSPSCWRARWI